MLIYEIKKRKLDIYHLKVEQEKLKRYKKDVLENRNKGYLIYYLWANTPDSIMKFLSSSTIDLNKIDFNIKLPDTNKNRKFSYLKSEPYTKSIQEILNYYEKTNGIFEDKYLLDRYINGEYDASPIVKVLNGHGDDFHLLRTNNTNKEDYGSGREWEIRNLINLPEELYLLQLLLLGKYDLIGEKENLEEQLNLFDIEYLKSIKLSDIMGLFETGLVKGSYEETLEKADKAALVLERIKNKRG